MNTIKVNWSVTLSDSKLQCEIKLEYGLIKTKKRIHEWISTFLSIRFPVCFPHCKSAVF